MLTTSPGFILGSLIVAIVCLRKRRYKREFYYFLFFAIYMIADWAFSGLVSSLSDSIRVIAKTAPTLLFCFVSRWLGLLPPLVLWCQFLIWVMFALYYVCITLYYTGIAFVGVSELIEYHQSAIILINCLLIGCGLHGGVLFIYSRVSASIFRISSLFSTRETN